jgi:hypothetical protein
MREGEDHRDDSEYSDDQASRGPGMAITLSIAVIVIAIGIYLLTK